MTFPESASCVAVQYAQPKEAGLGEVCAASEEVVRYLAGIECQKKKSCEWGCRRKLGGPQGRNVAIAPQAAHETIPRGTRCPCNSLKSGTCSRRLHSVHLPFQVSKISLVDLAGSERADSTGAKGTRLKVGPGYHDQREQ